MTRALPISLLTVLAFGCPLGALAQEAESPSDESATPDSSNVAPPPEGSNAGPDTTPAPDEALGAGTPVSPAEEEARPTPDGPAPPRVPPGGVPTVGPPVVTAEPVEPEGPPPPPPPPPTYSVELQVRGAFPSGSGFDRALSAHRYTGTRAAPVFYAGFALPALEWLWLGGRLGTRGLFWSHPDRDPASAAAVDLLATAQLRFLLGRVVELGVLAGGGAGWTHVLLNGRSADQVVGRFSADAIVAFRVGANFAIGLRAGWDYFVWENMNSYGHSLDLGGFTVGLAIEGRE